MFSIMSSFATLFLALIATSAVSARVVPRSTPPSGWDTADLEVCRLTPIADFCVLIIATAL
jgi:hypothetical protein